MHTALITNSSIYVSHPENSTPQPVIASITWLIHSAFMKRCVVPRKATRNSAT